MGTITRIYNGDDGRSHFEAMDPPFGLTAYSAWSLESAPPERVTEISFHRAEPGVSLGWHPAPRRQYISILAGELEVETGDGAVRRFGPGTMFLVEDVAGKGHLTKFVGNEPCTFAFVPLAQSATG